MFWVLQISLLDFELQLHLYLCTCPQFCNMKTIVEMNAVQVYELKNTQRNKCQRVHVFAFIKFKYMQKCQQDTSTILYILMKKILLTNTHKTYKYCILKEENWHNLDLTYLNFHVGLPVVTLRFLHTVQGPASYNHLHTFTFR